MASPGNFNDTLYRLYEHYVGEPESSKDVYGYWVFILGCLIAFVGLVAFLVMYGGGAMETDYIKVAGILGMIALTLCLFGIVLMLPVRKRGIQASVLGMLIAFAGVSSFGIVYPDDWRMYGGDYTIPVITTYAAGIAVLAGITALIPAITGQKGKYVAEEGATEDPPVLTGDALDGAQFAAFRDEDGDWQWRILHLEALAASMEGSLTRPDAEADIEAVKSEIGSAGLMELTTSAFRLYETADGEWQWTLVREDGSVVARCGDAFADRDGAEEAVSFLKDRGPVADVIEIEDAAFNYYEERDRWHWQLLDDERRALAVSPTDYGSKADAEAGASSFVEDFEDAGLLSMDEVGIELLDTHEGWTWRVVDTDDVELATAEDAYDSRRDAEAAVEALLPALEEAAVTVAGEPTYELFTAGHEWRWRLVGRNERVVARNPNTAGTYQEIEETTDRFAENVEDADVFEIDGARYERYRIGEDWRWRLVTEDRSVIAASTEPHQSADAAQAAIERMREQADEADLIEFEQSAFQVYEADQGEWRWRLIDEDGNVLADSGAEHGSKSEAAEAMMTLKEQAPNAELLEIETAAFELFVDDGDWGWRLIDDGGKLIAEDPGSHPTRGAARQAMDQLVENLDTESRTMEAAAFQTYVSGDDWNWRFVLPDGTVVAENEEAASTRDQIESEIERIRAVASSAGRSRIGDVFVQIYGSDAWRFRLLDRDRTPVATGADTYDDRDAVHEAVDELTSAASEAPIFQIEDAVIRLTNGSGWSWELIDSDRTVLGRSGITAESRETATELIDELRHLAPLAGRVDFDVASYELVSRESGWSWRLIDENGAVVAECAELFETTDGARSSIEDTRDLIPSASILEIDGVSFELHDSGDGWVWRLVDEHGETMSESTKSYQHRTDAREAMTAVKVHAPDGWIEFTE
ncbi:YegP family protein [Halovivax limisalsi]|uniref:YegP family protein n=1 Tax=Halovivax limisalsi TaxID=1453760 RepID=UPI001FFD28ED|nr:YegP family protein [Halovivax limisalsi]